MIKALVLVLFITIAWCDYTLTYFDTILPPYYFIGLSNQKEYYESYISDFLLANGRELATDDVNTDNWSIYYSKHGGFSFLYPPSYFLRVINSDSVGFEVSPGEFCQIQVLKNGGFMISMPRLRSELRSFKRQHISPDYIRITDTAYLIGTSTQKGKTRFETTYFHNNGQHALISFENNCDHHFVKGVLATFQNIQM